MNLKTIKKLIIETRIVNIQLFKIIVAILLIIPLTWGVSQANDIIFSEGIESASTNFSIIGVVSEIRFNKILIEKATGSDSKTKDIYVLDISNLETVETSTYAPLVLSDIKIGDTVIGQGLTNGHDYFITRIVSFAIVAPAPIVDIATSTPEAEVATTTEEQASTTSSTTDSASSTPEAEVATTTEEQASTTPSLVETVTDVVEDVVDTITEIIETVVDAVTGSSPEEPVPPAPEEPAATPEPDPAPEEPAV